MASEIAQRLKNRARSEVVQLSDDLSVRVRGLSLRGKLAYQSRLTEVVIEGEGKNAKEVVRVKPDADLGEAAAHVLLECVLNDDGSHAFTSAAELDELDAEDAAKLFEKARELSGLTAEAEAEIEKNS